MSTTAIALFVLGGGLLTPADTQSSTASAQLAVARNTASQKIARSPATPPGTGGYLDVDDCNAGSTALGSGSMAGVPFTTGTTGVEHQNEPLCYAFGTSGITNDVWFNWSAAATGNAVVDFCGNSIDTKVASYNDDNGGNCPLGGALACNDDTCGLQSTISFAVTGGSSYVLQVGTFPGASGGSGSFNITETTPPPCGQYDDGSTENALGWVAGGEMGWIHYFDCLNDITEIHTAYGAAAYPGTVTNGNASQVFIHSDTDSDPANGTTWLETINTTVTNGNTDILNLNYITSGTVNGNGHVGATAVQVAGEFPAPMDQASSGPETYLFGSYGSGATADVVNLNNNLYAPTQMTALGYPSRWLLRAVGAIPGPGTPYGFCDGSGTPAPCGNTGATGNGCANSVFSSGCNLFATGVPSVSSDTIVLHGDSAIPSQFGLYFQGDVQLNPGSNCVIFGDGLRCAGVNVRRLQTIQANLTGGPGSSSTTVCISCAGGVSPGDTKHYQLWYRDPAGPCASGFNLSNGYSISWAP